MNKKLNKQDLKEQNQFLRDLKESLEDIKAGRVHDHIFLKERKIKN